MCIAKPRVIFVLGGPASGKGTQCTKLADEFGMKHLSAGELLREEQASGSTNGAIIDSIIKEGKIVPVQITLDLLKRAILGTRANRFLIDGFPRNWDNLHGWEGSMLPVCDLEAVMFIDCPEEELEKRLLSRGLTSGRSDDNLATAKKRFATFYAATMPIVEHYESRKKLIRVRGDASIDSVFSDLTKALEPLIREEILGLTEALVEAERRGDADTIKHLTIAAARDRDEDSLKFAQSSKISLRASSESGFLKNATVKIEGKKATASFAGTHEQETRVWNLIQGRWLCVLDA